MNMSGKNLTRTLLSLGVMSVFALAAVIAIVKPGASEPAVIADTSTAANQAGFNTAGIFAQFNLGGVTLGGFNSSPTFGNDDLSEDWTELVWASHSGGSLSAVSGGSRDIGRITMEPFTIVKSVDQLTPKLLQAMVQNQTVSVVVRTYGVNPEEGISQHEFTYTLENGRVVSQRTQHSLNTPNSAGEYSSTETIAITFAVLTITDEINSVEHLYNVVDATSS